MKFNFTKMQGIGNDYVYIDCFKYNIENPSELAKIVSDRHYSIGSDGLILVCKSEHADVRMAMYNADGSQSEMCGNGARCVAKFAYDSGYVTKDEFILETLAGDKKVVIKEKDDKGLAKLIQIDMGVPKLDSKLPEKINIVGEEKEFIGIDMGNPHAIYYVDSKKELYNMDLEKIGDLYETHKRFPNKVNSEFIYVEDKKNIYMRVWERGSGETLACGTGATASAYASILKGVVDKEVVVHLKGGDLKINYDESSSHIYMTGEAKTVFVGEIEI